ncbi:hypothetical protein EDEG_00119 [Edhazardia aedis USNM 41457]|uniref:Translation initiation factor beta propellor-like domain-containing protein n=1 Tax=Edhazardia aedis (strain USNM 41457) TaxID=1003232 RepID=J9DBN2_EDHAE|nr:hypothetical protein EDEG_00119 [Edhazardia aedis USNM 41457]|eukprot:EJW04899.1 hypothetical protein EDEG_00119 [Edhazardia aedis USNM 41457]
MLNQERCLIILNLPSESLSANIQYLHSLHTGLYSIRETNSVNIETTLISQMFSKQQALEAVKNINMKCKDDDVRAFTYEDYISIENVPENKYKPCLKFTVDDLLSFQYDFIENKNNENADPQVSKNLKKNNIHFKNECFLVTNDNKLTILEVEQNGNLNETFKKDSEISAVSENGVFVATYNESKISIYANHIDKENKTTSLELFSEINKENVQKMFFEKDMFLVVCHKNIFDFTCVFDILSGSKIFEGKIGSNKVKFNGNGDLFFIEGTNQCFRLFSEKIEKKDEIVIGTENFINNELSPSNITSGMEIKNLHGSDIKIEKIYDPNLLNILQRKEKMKATLQTEIYGQKISNVEIYYAYNNIEVLVTSGKTKKMLIYKDKKLFKTRNCANVEEIKFYNSSNRLYCFTMKVVAEREIYLIESFLDDQITVTQIDSKIVDAKFADTFFVIFNTKNELKFFNFGVNSTFEIVGSYKKKHKVLLSLKHKMCALYDYNSDSIEFYDKGKKLRIFSHPNCNKITWAKSGLYYITAGVQSSAGGGLVQIFDCNGKFLCKRVFNKLENISWRPFVSLKKINKLLYDKVKNNINAETECIKDELNEVFTDTKKETAELLLQKWKDFIANKKKEIIEFYNEQANLVNQKK